MKSQRKKTVRRPRARGARTSAAGERDALMRVLAERNKELALLHQAARLLQTSRPLDRAFFDEIVHALPPAWQYPDACAARLTYGTIAAATPGWRRSRLSLREEFRTADGTSGCLEVIYVEDRLKVSADPFLKEERQLIKSLADMLVAYIDRAQGENRVRRLSRTYEVLSGINSAIVRLRDREKLFREACRIAVEHGEFGVAWIGKLEASARSIKPLVWTGPRLDFGLLDSTARSIRIDMDGAGPVARSVRERRAIYCNDITLDPTVVDREALLKLGLRAFISLPLIVKGTVIGVFGMHTAEVGFFDDEEIRLLEELAADISFGLEYMGKEDEIADLAYHEPITHLPNRASLQRRMSTAVEEAAAKQHVVALMLIDLNHFRDINNSLGHQNGDVLLQHVAETLRKVLWESDRVASLGGDEFAIVLPRLTGTSDVEIVLGKIRSALEAPVHLGGVPVNVEFTLGAALYPDDGDTADALWQHADVALSTAKQRHEPYLRYSSEFDHYDPERLALVSELRDAIPAGQLLLHFQPIIDVQNSRATGVEALVRWQHPRRGLIFPDVFIPLAERTGLINPLTARVLEAALRQGAALHAAGLPLLVSANLSARNLQDAKFSSTLLELVQASGFPKDRIVLEITESAIMDDPMRARRVLNRLHLAGMQISMDDFGIGQSSLSYLKDLPITRIKIDKSFVISYWQARNAAIVRSAIELARNLELKVTAEGVEDEATYLELRKLGCDLAQGYYFSKPLPPDRLQDWLRNSEWARAPAA